MKRNILFLIVFSLCLIAPMQCSDKSTESNSPANQPASPSDLTSGDKALAQSDNIFGFKLFHEILNESGDDNVFISPLSVALALTMIYNGANGTTKDVMQTTLELQGMTSEEINQSCRNLIDILTAIDPSVAFNIANSIWYREGIPLQQDFIDVNAQYLYAEVQAIDFGESGAVDKINGWVSENTNGKIRSIVDVDQLQNLIMLLLNAIYFKGSWSDKFNADLTTTQAFHIDDQNDVECDMMMKESTFDSYANENYVAVRLPYGGDSAFNMIAVMPPANSDIDRLADQFDMDEWKTVLSNLHPFDCDLGLPKFEIKYEKSLVEALTALGMGEAFGIMADFSGMSAMSSLQLSNVVHKTYIEVNEEGTEAAAVTGGLIITTITPAVLFDRPFLVFVYEKNSGAIIFAGRVMDPTVAAQ